MNTTYWNHSAVVESFLIFRGQLKLQISSSITRSLILAADFDSQPLQISLSCSFLVHIITTEVIKSETETNFVFLSISS